MSDSHFTKRENTEYPFHHYPYITPVHDDRDGHAGLLYVKCPCGWVVGPIEESACEPAAFAHVQFYGAKAVERV